MTERDIANQELENNLDFVPIEWASVGLDLQPGTVLYFAHDSSRINYFFECTGLEGGRATSGRLTEMVDGQQVITREAEISLVHFKPTMASPQTKFAQFFYAEDDRSVTVTPAFTMSEMAFSPKLARQVFSEEALRKELEPFQHPTVVKTLVRLQSYFETKATALAEDTDYTNANRQRTAAELVGNLLDKVLKAQN